MTHRSDRGELLQMFRRSGAHGVGEVGAAIWIDQMTIFDLQKVLATTETHPKVNPAALSVATLWLELSPATKWAEPSRLERSLNQLIWSVRIRSDELTLMFTKLPSPEELPFRLGRSREEPDPLSWGDESFHRAGVDTVSGDLFSVV